jgi:GDP-L-fucose synthase
MVNNDIEKDSKIFVTGGFGFLGKHVRRKLAEQGYRDVFSYDAESYDLRSQDEVHQLFSRTQPEVVIHLAATVGGIGENKRRPADFFYDNLIMGLELMRASRDFNVRKFIQIGSACGYPKNIPAPFHEDDLWSGYPEETSAPYGVAKRVLSTYAQALREQHGFNAVYLIPTNMYGPGDNFNPETSHVIPAIIGKIDSAIQRGQAVVNLWGSGHATRQFLYVEDCATAIVKALEVYNDAEPINLAGGDELSIRQLAHDIGSLMGYAGMYIWDSNQPDGQPRRCLDTTRAEKLLDFRAGTGIIQGLESTIAWYRGQK